ncbi:hypothetical protein CSUI_006783, partial [Cystoisospora suis]
GGGAGGGGLASSSSREELCEGMQKVLKCIYLTNVSFEASLQDIEDWISSLLHLRPARVFPCPSYRPNPSHHHVPPPPP